MKRRSNRSRIIAVAAILAVLFAVWIVTGGAKRFMLRRAFAKIDKGTSAILAKKKDLALRHLDSAAGTLRWIGEKKLARSVTDMRECLYGMGPVPSDVPNEFLDNPKCTPLFYNQSTLWDYVCLFVKHPHGLIFYQRYGPTDFMTADPVVEDFNGVYFVYWKRTRSTDSESLFAIASTRQAADEIAGLGRKKYAYGESYAPLKGMDEYMSKVRKIDFRPPWPK